MSRFDRVVARRMEQLVTRRRPKAGHKTGVLVHKQHVQGDLWWRMRIAELYERRREAAP